jgi:hypothetical protein
VRVDALSVSLFRFSSRSLCIVLRRRYSYDAARFSFVEVDGRRRQWVFWPFEKNRGSFQPYVASSCSVATIIHHLLSGPLIATPEEDYEDEMRFLCASAVVAFMYARPAPDDIIPTMAQRYALKVKFGRDEVLFQLRRDDEFRSVIDGAEKRSLDTPTYVEVKPSPIGGVGLFTTKDCLPGDLLLAERPMVSYNNFLH